MMQNRSAPEARSGEDFEWVNRWAAGTSPARPTAAPAPRPASKRDQLERDILDIKRACDGLVAGEKAAPSAAGHRRSRWASRLARRRAPPSTPVLVALVLGLTSMILLGSVIAIIMLGE